MASGKPGDSEDPANGGIRREPELPTHEHVVLVPSATAREFDFDEEGDNENDNAVKTRVLQRQFGNAVQQAPLDPGDGLAL